MHNLILIVIWLSGAAVDFLVTRAYWKVNGCWGEPIDTFWAIIVGLISSWLGALFGVILMGPPWKPRKLF